MGIKGKPKLERLIEDMNVGETGYVLPWALAFDKDETPFLNLRFTIYSAPSGNSVMPIKRTGTEDADYDIDLNFDFRGESYKWTPYERENLFAGVVGVDKSKIVQLEYDEPRGKLNPSDIQKLQDLANNTNPDDINGGGN